MEDGEFGELLALMGRCHMGMPQMERNDLLERFCDIHRITEINSRGLTELSPASSHLDHNSFRRAGI